MDLLERKRAIMSAFSLSMMQSVGLVKNKEITQHSLEIRQCEATDDECNRHNILMGVRDCASVAHVIGWYFEQQAECLKDPRIIFYGCYINDCLSIIYADSEDEALNIINKLKIGPCIIEWNLSQWSQLFLDMLLFVDKNNCLQHKPFRKARSHQERIPWISHHPFDVKRGTFIGEMSRLATLSSQNRIMLKHLGI